MDQVTGMYFKYSSAKGLSKIGSLIGKPLMVDKNKEKKVGFHFARMLVEVKVGDQFPEVVYFRNERREVIEQKVTYNWKPTICEVCHKYGHIENSCRRHNDNMKEVCEAIQVDGNLMIVPVETNNNNQMHKEGTSRGAHGNTQSTNLVNQVQEVGRNIRAHGGGWNQLLKTQNGYCAPMVVNDVVTITNSFQPMGKEGDDNIVGSTWNVGAPSSLPEGDG